MTGLLKQLRVSLLITLGMSVFTAAGLLLVALVHGDFLATLGDQAARAAVMCTFVALVHSVIYGAMHFGRPETREARGAWAGVGVLMVLDVVPLFATVHVVLALIPLLAAVGGWAFGRHAGATADAAPYGALFFGVASLLLQGVVALVMSIAGWL
ncbi:MAG: hypothetical protein JF597_26860 [Streptomyces sp.]|jgi:hypothetical protein|uniref:hypothetical protein n=1 Tax=Streptomyces sp. TaxID=1931 RepID=UPI0025D218DB|nr:hypothetical protein [Streptomyces sp.]MBW8797089.1 hypothetical protein [Streptomyces sp.]